MKCSSVQVHDVPAGVRFPVSFAPGGGFIRALSISLLTVFLSQSAMAADVAPFAASAQAIQLDKQINWEKASLIVVQDAGRYKTFDSFAREAFSAMYGAEHLPGLSPMASAMEWLFHRDAYADAPVVHVRDKGLRIEFTINLPEDKRQRVIRDGKMTPREFLDPSVSARIDELEPKAVLVTAIRRVRDAEVVVRAMERMLRIVPQPGGDAEAMWFAAEDVLGSVSDDVLKQLGTNREALGRTAGPIDGLSQQQALDVLLAWSGLRAAWLAGNTANVQQSLDRLSQTLPTLAAPGVYPSRSQRAAERTYYRMGKFTGGWMLYFIGFLLSIWALVTRWRTPWILALAVLLGAMAFHAYGVSLRWYILGRIPIANMFEAVIGSAWLGVAVGLTVELIFRSRVFLLAANALGFLALVIGGYVIPGGGTITTIMGILDDVMLRIHTLLIIWSYALIFLAAVIAAVYLLGYYFAPRGAPVTAGAGGGGARRGAARGGIPTPATVPAGLLGASLMAGAGAGTIAIPLRSQRPIMAGAMPGDESQGERLPLWLHHTDWCHLIILNLVFVMLFVGTVLGAVWADYSWGRPWGWDPKEVFALNTWLVYAILIHTRFFVKRRGLWTAWLSIAGCLMMAFNWAFVNFFIVGLHSYA
ncbi:MAG: cytochrome c biogenesis protein CcsA [Phycisphaerae bacterium]